MDRARLHEGIRRMRFTDVLDRSEWSELSQMEAGRTGSVSHPAVLLAHAYDAQGAILRGSSRHSYAGPSEPVVGRGMSGFANHSFTLAGQLVCMPHDNLALGETTAQRFGPISHR